MPTFKVSQGEHWSRAYHIEAETFEEAKKIYDKYDGTGYMNSNVSDSTPEYIEDIPSDRIWFDENGQILDGKETYFDDHD